MDYEPLQMIEYFYPADDPAKAILIAHSTQVMNKALEILSDFPQSEMIDVDLVRAGAMLHDIGICRCHAPDIGCHGQLPYLAHGVAGAAMLREISPEWERVARICERHTGTGLTAREIRSRALPLPEQDFLPETAEEKLVCLADKFFSKSADMAEKTLPQVRRSIARFGSENIARFENLCQMFGVKEK